MTDLSLGWELMGFGLAGVFTTLLAFMGVIGLIVKLLPEKKDGDGSNK